MAQTLAKPALVGPWWKDLTRYHWFVLIVAALGWLFDCLDQQLFNLARVPAMKELLPPGTNVAEYGGYATAIFLIGWATGGLTFGVLGDRIGRARTMMFTILIYSLCTGLSALSQGFWDFAFYRFITGLGVGGEFAVGVSLVAEVMPDKARPYALGLLQALSTVGNISAALISMGLGHMEETGAIGSAWRWMFVIGAFPAMLALIVRRRLKEPERWKHIAAAKGGKQLGSYAELFGNPHWPLPAVLALSCIAAIVVVAFAGQSLPRLPINFGIAILALLFGLLAVFGGPHRKIPGALALACALAMIIIPMAGASLKWSGLLAAGALGLGCLAVSGGPPCQWRRNAMVGVLLAFCGVVGLWGIGFFSIDLIRSVLSKEFTARGLAGTELSGRLNYWVGITSMMLNLGAFFGIYGFGLVAQRIGRKPTFAIAFALALVSTASVFWYLNTFSQIFWMIPIMGVCQLALFGGYAIYFPELFPTHLRSTGISFCYNVGRFVAASGPAVLGLLTSRVFEDKPEPMRYAGLTMCAIFLLGLIVIPFAPETNGRPLPEDERGFAH